MHEETRRKLDETLNGESGLERKALVLGGVLALLFGLFFVASNTNVSDREVSGKVQWAVWKTDHDTGERYPSMQIVLNSGRLVRASTLQHQLPPVGAKINVREKLRATGYRSYSWEGGLERPE